jgi:two-component system, cell cycle sensor histidine kinase DivJ
MKADVNGLALAGKSVRRPPADSRSSSTMEIIEVRRPASRHPSRMQSPVAAEMREIGLMLHEILAIADIMREAYGSGEMENLRHRLSLLRSKTATLESALSNVIMLSTLETEPTDATCERLDIVALLHEVSEAARTTLGDKPVTVMDASCPGPVVIYSDLSIIRQIMTCLMSNAAKCTSRGRIALILGRDDDKIRLTVADTGRGMELEQIKAVLKPSGRKYVGERNGPAGAGRGLRIVKELVSKLNGGISIASKPGEGTIVEVSLPLEPLQ